VPYNLDRIQVLTIILHNHKLATLHLYDSQLTAIHIWTLFSLMSARWYWSIIKFKDDLTAEDIWQWM